MDIIKEYLNINKLSSVPKQEYPVFFVPHPSDVDYKKGIIKRYFCKRIGNENKNIIEIDESFYKTKDTNLNSIYVFTSLNWKISGNRNTVLRGKIVESVGVEEYNLEQISNINNNFETLKQLLSKDLKQFWLGH